jgi:hypothetical protein
MTKSVVGMPFAVVFLAVLACGRYRLAACCGYAAGLAVSAAAFGWAMGGYSDFMSNTSEYLKTQRHRYGRFIDPRWYLRNYYSPMIALMIPFVPTLWKSHREKIVLFLGTAASGACIMMTGSIQALTHGTLLGTCLGMALFLLKEPVGRFRRLRAAIPVLGLIFVFAQSVYASAMAVGFSMQLFRSQKSRVWYNVGTVHSHTLRSEPLKGWRSPEDWGSSLDSIVDYVNTRIPREDSILALAPWEIVYAMTGRESFPGIPYEFVPKDLPPPGPYWISTVAAIRQNQPDWIITYVHPNIALFNSINEIVYYLKLDDFLKTYYDPEAHWGTTLILKRRPKANISNLPEY